MDEIDLHPESKYKPEKGKVLISEPFLNDPYFKRTVVLLCDHEDNKGSFGFILNKPLDIHVSELISEFPDPSIKVGMGGPVEPNSMFYLHARPDLMPESSVVFKDLCLGNDFELLKDLIRDNKITSDDYRFFIGYSGWGENQLKDEMEDKSWIVGSTSIKNILHPRPDKLWSSILKKMGKRFAILANFPEDPSLN